MAAVKPARVPVLTLAGLALVSCGKPVGLDVPVTPLVQIHVLVPSDSATLAALDGGAHESFGGDLDAGNSDGGAGPTGAGGSPTQLHAALVWGLQRLPEPFCILPLAGADVVQGAGCRDSFGFIPDRVAADTPITPGVPASLDLYTLPAADVMVGDITGRIAYGSVYIYQDTNGNGVLDLRHPPRQRRRGEPIDDAAGTADKVYGASFISMTLPDRRVSFLEGSFSELQDVAFYPREGCAAPPDGFSILSASGFPAAAAIARGLAGETPPAETDPAQCQVATTDDTIIVPLQDPAGLTDLACTTNDKGGVTYYRAAPTDPVDLRNRAWACTGFPQIGVDGGAPSGQQLVVSGLVYGPYLEPCKYTRHYTLRGCENDPFCASPSWGDPPVPPPAWWPCTATP
jgi:hypothetical protein